MKSKFILSLLFVITLVASFLRLYKLDTIPPGVNRDEASIGYSAYSLITTGKDEYGRSWPISFQSFGDWKLPLYIYTTMPFVAIFGLTELAVRLPSAIAGTLTVFITFFLVKELFRNKKDLFDIWHWSFGIPITASLLLAISPWHLHLSRVESESNVAVFLTTVGLLLFFKGLKQHRVLPFSALFLTLPYFTYHGNHVASSLLIAGLVVLFRSQIPRNRFSLVALIILVTLPAGILSKTFHNADRTKLAGISIFGDPSVIHAKIELPRLSSGNPNALITRLRYNRVTYVIQTVTRNYLASFGPTFLFLRGGTNRAHNIEGMGNLYVVEAVFFYLGILILIQKRKKLPYTFLLWWIFISPIAASITKDAPHTNRMFPIYPLPPILTAIGIMTLLKTLQKPQIQKAGIIIVSIVFLLNISYYLNQYFVNFPKNEASHWGAPYKKLTDLILQEEYRQKPVVITHPEYSPYIFLLFYTSYPPHLYQQSAVRYPLTADAFYHVKSFDRFTFRPIDWTSEMGQTRSLLVDFFDDIPQSIRSTEKLAHFGIVNASR